MTPYSLSLPQRPHDPFPVLQHVQSRLLPLVTDVALAEETVKPSIVSGNGVPGAHASAEAGVYLQQGTGHGAVVKLSWASARATEVTIRVVPGSRTQVWLQGGSIVAGLAIGLALPFVIPFSLGQFALPVALLGGAAFAVALLLVVVKLELGVSAASKAMMSRLDAVVQANLSNLLPPQ